MPVTRLSYVVNAVDQLVRVSADWDRYAASEGGPLAQAVLGRPLWDFVSSDSIVRLYWLLLKEVRAGRTLGFLLRCDSPDVHRLLDVRLRPTIQGGVIFETTAALTRRRAIADRRPGSWERIPLRLCGTCGSVEWQDEWLRIDDAVRRLNLFVRQVDPELHEAACPLCAA